MATISDMDIWEELVSIEEELRKLAYDPTSEWMDHARIVAIILEDYRSSCKRLNSIVYDMFGRNIGEIRVGEVDFVSISELDLNRLKKEVGVSKKILDRLEVEVSKELSERLGRKEELPEVGKAHSLLRRIMSPLMGKRREVRAWIER